MENSAMTPPTEDKPMKRESDSEMLRRVLDGIDTTSLCDIKKDLRVMSTDIRPVKRGSRLLGRARTVRCHNDFLTVIKALHEAKKGEVLVIDGSGGTKALLGELFSLEAQRKKLSGIIVDGACRDVASIEASGFPVFSKWHTPMAGTCKELSETQTSIVCGGVNVEPGDIIFADIDGIVVMSDEELSTITEGARLLQKVEGLVLQAVKDGRPLLDMTNAEKHLEAIGAGRESKLSFNLLNEADMN
jgi:RraA family protein